jgi:predicted amidohydrolase
VKLRVGLVQMASGPDIGMNLDAVERSVAEAARAGAEFVALPEVFNYRGVFDPKIAEDQGGRSLTLIRRLTRRHHIAILAGSLWERSTIAGRVFNTSVLIGADGETMAVYRKAHLFRIDLGADLSEDENLQTDPGDRVVVAQCGGVSYGLSICFDLRFPELYRVLALDGAQVLCVPSNFSATTGQAHWEPLLRARAIENQAFVIAPAQIGQGGDGFNAHGHTMAIDPWGTVLATLEDGQGVMMVDLDLDRLVHVRRALPAWSSRRPDLYGGLDRADAPDTPPQRPA